MGTGGRSLAALPPTHPPPNHHVFCPRLGRLQISESASSVFGGEHAHAAGGTGWAPGAASAALLCGVWPTDQLAPVRRRLAGAAFDILHLTLHQLLAILTTAGCAMAAGWAYYAWKTNRDEASRGHLLRSAYLPVRQSEGS